MQNNRELQAGISSLQSAKWQPSAFIKASAVLHVGAAAALAVPEAIAWGVGSLVANHAALTAAGLWPKSTLLGPNIRRLDTGRPEIAITIDDGPDPDVTPLVLDILAEHGVKATFFCIAAKARAHPELVRRIADEGHHIENHSMQHRHYFSVLGMGGLKKELQAAQQTLQELSGRTPRYFRAPAGLRNPFLDPVLHRLGLQLVSWTRRGFDTRVNDAHRIMDSLLRNVGAGDILLIHDGNAARCADGKPVILRVLPDLLAKLKDLNLRCVTLQHGLDPSAGDAAFRGIKQSS